MTELAWRCRNVACPNSRQWNRFDPATGHPAYYQSTGLIMPVLPKRVGECVGQCDCCYQHVYAADPIAERLRTRQARRGEQ
jgi:hypothetical protein